VSSLLQEVTVVGPHQRLCLVEYDHQVEAKDCLITDLRKGNRELLQQTHILERRNKEMNDELLRANRSHDFKSDALDSIHSQLQDTQDELTLAQNYVHHLDAELQERDQQLETSQAQTEELVDIMHHM
jgi:septal ring factor EnvC (AmiA/AmiB activator)